MLLFIRIQFLRPPVTQGSIFCTTLLSENGIMLQLDLPIFAATAMPVDTVVTGTIAKQEASPVFLAENLL